MSTNLPQILCKGFPHCGICALQCVNREKTYRRTDWILRACRVQFGWEMEAGHFHGSCEFWILNYSAVVLVPSSYRKSLNQFSKNLTVLLQSPWTSVTYKAGTAHCFSLNRVLLKPASGSTPVGSCETSGFLDILLLHCYWPSNEPGMFLF